MTDKETVDIRKELRDTADTIQSEVNRFNQNQSELMMFLEAFINDMKEKRVISDREFSNKLHSIFTTVVANQKKENERTLKQWVNIGKFLLLSAAALEKGNQGIIPVD